MSDADAEVRSAPSASPVIEWTRGDQSLKSPTTTTLVSPLVAARRRVNFTPGLERIAGGEVQVTGHIDTTPGRCFPQGEGVPRQATSSKTERPGRPALLKAPVNLGHQRTPPHARVLRQARETGELTRDRRPRPTPACLRSPASSPTRS